MYKLPITKVLEMYFYILHSSDYHFVISSIGHYQIR